MGVWGTGPLDNDGAADLVVFVERAGAGGWALILKALRSSRDTHESVAAAELVAIALGAGHGRDDRRLDFFEPRKQAGPWAKRFARQMPAGAPDLAVRAVRAALRVDLGWSRPADARRWQSNLQSLLRRLGGSSSRSARSTSNPRARRRRPSRARRARRY